MKRYERFEQFIEDADSTLPKKTAEEAAKLVLDDRITGYDRKLIANTVVELNATARLLQDIRTIPKVTIFGSARTAPDHPDYILCKQFAKQIADLGYMNITGAGPGIMAAAPEGAGPDMSIGVSVELPFETGVNEFLAKSKRVVTYKYFFCRKIAFIREADAIVLFPGGFGTMDEAFEALTLLHTGRAMPVPFVLMEHEGSNYWQKWIDFVQEGLLDEGMVSKEDMYIFRRFSDPVEATDYINNFYRRYHSLRYIGKKIVVRLNSPIPDGLLKTLNEEYAEFLGNDGLQRCEALPQEADEPDLADMPRLVMEPNLRRPVDLYCLVRSINREVFSSSTRKQDGDLRGKNAPARPTRLKQKKKTKK